MLCASGAQYFTIKIYFFHKVTRENIENKMGVGIPVEESMRLTHEGIELEQNGKLGWKKEENKE